MINIANSVSIPEIINAARKANALLQDPSFYAAIKAHQTFDLSNISPSQVADLMQKATIVMTVEMYYSSNRRVFGYDDPAHPQTIHINSHRNEFNIPALTNTMIHETVHAVNNLHPEFEFGHGDNSSRGKENTAPYWIGSLAQKMAGGTNIDTQLQIHEGSPEAFEITYTSPSNTTHTLTQDVQQMKKNYSVTLKGTDGGQLNFVDIKLNHIDIALTSTDGEVTWTNDNVEINFTPPLPIYLSVKAVQGTTWDIVVQEIGAADPCYKAKGKTGDQPGGAEPGLSIRDTKTNCI